MASTARPLSSDNQARAVFPRFLRYRILTTRRQVGIELNGRRVDFDPFKMSQDLLTNGVVADPRQRNRLTAERLEMPDHVKHRMPCEFMALLGSTAPMSPTMTGLLPISERLDARGTAWPGVGVGPITGVSSSRCNDCTWRIAPRVREQ